MLLEVELLLLLEVVPLEVEPLEVVPLEVVPLEVVPLEVEPVEVEPLEVEPLEVEPLEVEPAGGRAPPAGTAVYTMSRLPGEVVWAASPPAAMWQETQVVSGAPDPPRPSAATPYGGTRS